MKRIAVLVLGPLAIASCSLFILDFDDVKGLPCPCDPDHVCLAPSNTCFPRRSVDLFKSCDLGADSPDDLCDQGAICQGVNDNGLRCLLTCTPSTYGTPDSGVRVASQCPAGTTCWSTPRGGVCSEGICNDIPNNCPPPDQCVRINGAGVCFTPCQIFERNPPPCAGTQICHPIADSSLTACINSGPAQLGEICTDTEICAQGDRFGRSMICDRPMNSSERRRCQAVCQCLSGQGCDNTRCTTGAPCVQTRASVGNMVGIGICEEP